jgi:hypothetical protein
MEGDGPLGVARAATDAAARLARAADSELAAAGLNVGERARLLMAAAELRVLAEGSRWPELRMCAATLEIALRRVTVDDGRPGGWMRLLAALRPGPPRGGSAPDPAAP